MAGPHLAGTVALMWSVNPALRGDVERTRQILQETARPFTGGLEGSTAPVESPISNEIIGAGGALAQVVSDNRSCLEQTDLSVIPNNVAGYGVVDVYAAVQAALALQ
jgi:hypothetical protein